MTALPWKRIGSEWQLFADRRVLARVVPDVTYAGMWRVKLPGGLSDMTNLVRAKDAARLIAARRTEPRANAAISREKSEQNQRAFSRSSPLVSLNGQGVPGVPSAAETHQRSPQDVAAAGGAPGAN
jgi:hypothetical protein